LIYLISFNFRALRTNHDDEPKKTNHKKDFTTNIPEILGSFTFATATIALKHLFEKTSHIK
jgi:hypothetical protein